MTSKEAENNNKQEAMIGFLSVLFSAALFGSVFTLAKVPLATVDPLVLSALVYVIAGFSLIPFAKISFKFDTRCDYIYFLIITVSGGITAPVLLLYGLQQTNASDASILANGEVIFTIILSAIFFGEKPKGKIGLFSIVLIIIGLFIATTNLKFSGNILQINAGNLMILFSTSLWALDNNVSRRLTSTASPAKIAMLKSLFGGLVLLTISIVLGKGNAITGIELDLWLLITILAILGFGGALLLFLHGIKRIGTVKTMSIFSMVPIFGIVIAAVVLGESVSIFQMIATGLIIAGILIISRH
jgi:drug/metabolite transporter (DMT)-like permease